MSVILNEATQTQLDQNEENYHRKSQQDFKADQQPHEQQIHHRYEWLEH